MSTQGDEDGWEIIGERGAPSSSHEVVRMYWRRFCRTIDSAPPLVAWHGFSGSGADFEVMASSLKGRLDIWAPDLLGHGGSSAPEVLDVYALEARLERLQRLLDVWMKSWEGLSAPVLLGYSMGGRLALHAALMERQPFRGLVLIGATPGIEGSEARLQRAKRDKQLALRLLSHGVADFARRWERQPLIATQARIPEPYGSALRSRRLLNSPHGLANSLLTIGQGVMPSAWGSLSDIRMPVLLVVGSEDRNYRWIAERMLSVLPNGRLALIPGGGHACHLEAPGLFAEILEEFITNFCS